MASFSCVLVILFLVFASAFAIDALDTQGNENIARILSYDHPAGKEGSLRLEECPGACAYRCSKTHHKKPCLFFCNKCCQKCLCVPSGTYGHKEECPCYDTWKTKEGTPKCP